MSRLADLSGDSRQLVEAKLLKAEELLREAGITQSKESILDALLDTYPTNCPGQLNDCCALYVFLRQKGQSHAEARDGIKAMFRGLGVKTR